MVTVAQATETRPVVTSAYTPRPAKDPNLCDHPKPLPKPRKPSAPRPSKGTPQGKALHAPYRIGPIHPDPAIGKPTLAIGVVADDYRLKARKPEPPKIEEIKGPIVAFKAPESKRAAKRERARNRELMAHAKPLIPTVATHGERPVQAEIAMHVALANNMAANGVPMPVAKLGSWGIGSPTIVGKRLVRESDGGGERARGITAAQWRDALSSRYQG